jgi:vitamin B12 transporter
VRRPRNRGSVGLNYAWHKKAQVSLTALYVGKREDRVFEAPLFTNVEMPSYTVVNIAGSYDVNKNVQLFARVDNVFDEKYQEITGYGTPGISPYAGVKVTF